MSDCLDHWHCDPREATHRCDAPDRARDCPTCGAESFTEWTTQDGRRIELVKMTQTHLENTMAHLERKQIARAAGRDPTSPVRAGRWLMALSAEHDRRRAAGLLVETRTVETPRHRNAGARLQRDWRWNGRPLRVRVEVVAPDSWRITWQRAHGREWRAWRSYVGTGALRDVIRVYRDYADEWRGRA